MVIVGTIFCGTILYAIIVNGLDKNDLILMGGFVFFAIIFLVGLWKLIRKDSIEYINMNGWKFKLFKKVNKYCFILITGGVRAIEFLLIYLLLILFKWIQWTSEYAIQTIVIIIVLFILVMMIEGWIIYKKYRLSDQNISIN
jgi:hypothetical protein